ncbi:Hypp8934 [Branchiostoma lanceolatum]|uniref:Hypp8934 protein n=1 Tax=Branchiostoma lanceolatum TaxID=7740 RepID=A0A8J9ZC14_BRALA|nr:Hypp8934 [Branchiostoma lanceolatum]
MFLEHVLIEQVLLEQMLVKQVFLEHVLVEQVFLEQVLIEQVFLEQVLIEQVFLEEPTGIMGTLAERKAVVQQVFRARRPTAGYLNAHQLQGLHAEIRQGGISLQQVEASIQYVCAGDGCEEDELYDVLQEMDRRYFLLQDLKWEFSLLDHGHSDSVTPDQARFMFEAVHGQLFSKRRWQKFLQSRKLPKSGVSFSEIEVDLCNIPNREEVLKEKLEEEQQSQERRKPPNYTRKKVVRPMRDSDLRAFGSWITSHNWDEVLQETNTQAKSTTFYTTLNQAIEKFLPAKTVRTHCRDKPWITPMIKSLISKRQRAFKKGDTCTWKHLRNKIAREISTAKNKHYHDNIKHLKSADPRKWYQNIKQMANLCSDPTDIEVPGVDQTCTQTVANAINRHLASTSQQLPPLSLADLPSFLPAPGPPPRVSVWEMYHRLRRVKLGKASGVDGISARLVREFAFELSTPVSDIFNSSLQEGTVPSVWKMADVVPVPKEKPPRLEKLRPISLTPIFAKVCEGFVTDWCLSDILPTIDPRQYGSLKGKSTTHYLTSLIHHLASTTDKPGYCNTLVLTDFTRAFDRVHHLTAVAKLLDLGVRRSIIPWVCAFLSNRQQRVKYQQVLSEWETLTCGVPQGTKLGPLVFLTLINDASPVSEDSAEAWKYVDDMSLSEARPVTHDSTLQTDVDSLVRWTEDNHMQLNPSKCMVMLICFMRNPPPPPVLTIKTSTLQVVQFAKILGVIFQANLKWDAHVNMMVNKGSRRLYLLRVLKRHGLDTTDLTLVFVGFIRPTLEYACPVWHPEKFRRREEQRSAQKKREDDERKKREAEETRKRTEEENRKKEEERNLKQKEKDKIKEKKKLEEEKEREEKEKRRLEAEKEKQRLEEQRRLEDEEGRRQAELIEVKRAQEIQLKLEAEAKAREEQRSKELEEAKDAEEAAKEAEEAENQAKKEAEEAIEAAKKATTAEEKEAAEKARKKAEDKAKAERESRIRNNLKVAIKSKEKKKLESAIQEFKKAKLKDTDGDLAAGERLIKMHQAKGALVDTMKKRKLSDLEKAVTAVKKGGFEVDMPEEMIQANKLMIRLKRLERLRQEVQNLKQSTVAEIRSYSKPPAAVHQVMIATYLLLGNPEKETKNWKLVQALVGKTGKEGLKRRVLECDPVKVPPAAASRAKEILDQFDLDSVRDVSGGAATFYVWAVGVVEEVEEEKEKSEEQE